MSVATAPRFSASFEDARAAMRAGDRRTVLGIALQQVLFGLVPLVFLIAVARYVLSGPNSAVDFRDAYWVAGQRLLHGSSPYVWTTAQIKDGVAFVYPALSALIFAPFALLPIGAGAYLATLFAILTTPAILWILGVRDWRVFGISLLWLPVFGAWQSANETIFLVAMVALVWRYRDNPLVAAVLTAIAISLKPFIWPLALWLLVTRRWRASAYTLLFGAAINLVSWSLLGWNQVRAYLHAAGLDSHYAWRAGYGVAAIGSHLGFGHSVGTALTVFVSIALAGAIFYAGFVKRRERQALTLTILLMLAASPLVWSHYFALLLVPVAIERPRLSWLWLPPVLMWLWACPPSLYVHGMQEAAAWVLIGTMSVALVRAGGTRRPQSPAWLAVRRWCLAAASVC